MTIKSGIWKCPNCNSLHHGFKKPQCQNPNCKLFKPYQEAQTMATRKPKDTAESTAKKTNVKKTNVKKTSTTKKTAPASKTKTKKPPVKPDAERQTKKKVAKSTSESENLSTKELQAQRAAKPIKWSDRRIAIVETLKKLGATKSSAAVSAASIVENSSVEMTVKQCKIHCDRYRGAELVAQGYVDTAKLENSRELQYYLSGKKPDFKTE